MNRRAFVGIVVAAALAPPIRAGAHEGHVHKVMGTIAARHGAQLEIRTREGKTVTITLNEKTSIVRGSEKAGIEALQPGERVVVDVGSGKAPLTARVIKLGTAAPSRK